MVTTPDEPDDVLLDAALGRALAAPRLPEGFNDRLHAAWRAKLAEDLARQRLALEADHARRLEALERGYVRLKRDTLALVLAVAFATGAVAAWALPWLRETYGIDLSSLAPLLAVGIGMGAGALAWIDRLGWPSWARR